MEGKYFFLVVLFVCMNVFKMNAFHMMGCKNWCDYGLLGLVKRRNVNNKLVDMFMVYKARISIIKIYRRKLS